MVLMNIPGFFKKWLIILNRYGWRVLFSSNNNLFIDKNAISHPEKNADSTRSNSMIVISFICLSLYCRDLCPYSCYFFVWFFLIVWVLFDIICLYDYFCLSIFKKRIALFVAKTIKLCAIMFIFLSLRLFIHFLLC